jgi:hypothetical protein
MKKADTNKPAVTMYPKSRRAVADCRSVLKQSKNKKLSKDKLPTIKKGKFAGYVIYTLTLEERATCPRYCYHWDDCYGNNMLFAHRIQHGPELEAALQKEVAELCATYRGVIIRLHVLGDFYSVDYVAMWQSLLTKFDNLAVWGFTGYKPTSDIGLAIRAVRGSFGERFAVRFSNAPDLTFSANSAEISKPEKGRSVVCPEQTGAAESCAACTVCWSAPERQVLFLTH